LVCADRIQPLLRHCRHRLHDGITQSKEYAEPEWYADIWLVIVWVAAIIRRPLFDESVYSMDGDIAPIAELCDVATAHSLHQA
jgi:hypothetical protein